MPDNYKVFSSLVNLSSDRERIYERSTSIHTYSESIAVHGRYHLRVTAKTKNFFKDKKDEKL